MANGELQRGLVPYEVNGEQHMFSNERTHVYFFINRPEISVVNAVTGDDMYGYNARRVTIFNCADALMYFSGIPMLSEEVDGDKAPERANEIRQKHGWTPNVHIMFDPPEDIEEKYQRVLNQAKVVSDDGFEQDLAELLNETWPANERPLENTDVYQAELQETFDRADPGAEFEEDDTGDPDQILLDHQVEQIGRRVLYEYFPAEWDVRPSNQEVHINPKHLEIFGDQIRKQ